LLKFINLQQVVGIGTFTRTVQSNLIEMNVRLTTVVALSLLLAVSGAVFARANDDADQAVLPVVDNLSGQIQAWLVLEPEAKSRSADAHWLPGSLGTEFGRPRGDSLALLCNRHGATDAVGHLANNCYVASLGEVRGTGEAAAQSRFGVSVGERRSALPVWMTRNDRPHQGEVDVNNLTIFAQKSIGDATYVSIAGTLAKATLIPYAAAPPDLGRAWSSKSLTLGGGYGAFSANIIGQVVDTPGQPRWEGVGLGLTWRTPWSGQLTVGADNIVTSGRNPFAPRGETRDEGTVPYVRYEQDF